MSYDVDLIKRNEQQITKWSGGTTTQLAIYPRNAEYKEGNFTWRLSSAKVDVEKSVFTCLPGISRILMVLDGNIKLEHLGHHSILLQPFEQDHFYGDWLTKSFGKARDFNLMMSKYCKGNLTAIILTEGKSLQVSDLSGTEHNKVTTTFYCVDGRIQIIVDNEDAYELNELDMLLVSRVHKDDKINLTIHNLEYKKVHVIQADIQY